MHTPISRNTHWKRVNELQKRYRGAKVMSDRLFVQDEHHYQRRIASGIDMALDPIEQHHGPRMAAAVAPRWSSTCVADGHQRQESIYLDHAPTCIPVFTPCRIGCR